MHFVPTTPEVGIPIILTGLGVGVHGLIKRSFFSPMHLFFCVHLIALGFCILQLFWTTNRFGVPFYLIMASIYVTFSVGCWLGGRKSTAPKCEASPDDWRDVYWIGFGIVSLFLLSRIVGGWPMLSSNPSNARMALLSGKFGAILFEIGMLGGILAAAGVALKKTWYYYALLIIVMAEILLTGNRGQALLFIFFALCLHEVVGRRSILKVGLLTAVAFGLIFTLVGVFRSREGNKLQEAASLFNSLKMLYMYICNGYWNFNVGIEKVLDGRQGLTWGVSSFSGLWFWLFDVVGVQKSFLWDSVFNETTLRYIGLNSICYLWPLIKDFGLVVAMLINVGIGYFLMRVYRNAESGGLSAYCYAFFGYAIFSSNNLLWTTEGLSTMVFLLVYSYVKFFKNGAATA